MNQDHRNMKTFRGFSLKPNVGLGLQNHFERKNTQEPARYSKWGGFKDLDWDFLDREFYSKGGKKRTEGQDDDEEMVLEEKVKLLGKVICFSDRNHNRNYANIYTVLHIFRQVLFVNQGNHQNFNPSLLSYK